MPLSTKTLAELAKLNLAIGPVFADQPNSPYASGSWPTSLANAGDGVAVDNSVWAEVIVTPTGGDVEFRIKSISKGKTTWESLDQLDPIWTQDAQPRKVLVFVGPAIELGVEILQGDGAATSAAVEIGPCNG